MKLSRRQTAALGILTTVLVGLGTIAIASNDTDSSTKASTEFTAAALAYLESNYSGRIEAVVSTDSITLADWARLEPSAGLAHAYGDGTDSDTAVHGVVVAGTFSVVGPVRPDGSRETSTYSSGRVVVADDGTPLQIRLWNGDKGAGGATFGPEYDESAYGVEGVSQ